MKADQVLKAIVNQGPQFKQGDSRMKRSLKAALKAGKKHKPANKTM